MKLRIAFATAKKGHKYDSLISLMNECHRRGHEVSWYVFEETTFEDGRYLAPLYLPKFPVEYDSQGMISSAGPNQGNLAEMDVVYLKRDPPVNEKVLELIQDLGEKTLVVNNPRGIKKYLTKHYLADFSKYTVPTHFVTDVKEAERVVKKLGNCVIKEEISHGGYGIHHVFEENGTWQLEQRGKEKQETTLPNFLEQVTEHGTKEIVIVKYLKNVIHGDKRIHVLDGTVLGAILRVPQKGGWLCNIKSGGEVEKTEVTPKEQKAAEEIAAIMRKDGIYIIGIDTLEDDDGTRIVSEVNSTNVGAFHIHEKLYNRNMSPLIVDWLEAQVKRSHNPA
jgi:glutathione synthase